MGKIRGLRDGTGPYSRGAKRMRRADDICPFDKDNVEKIDDMDFRLNVGRDIKVVSDKVGKGRFVK